MLDVVYMNGDFVVSFEGSDFVTGLDIDEFHTYRFESLDGINYHISVDGLIFIVDSDTGTPNGYHYVQFGGWGGCGSQQIPNMKNEWDFVRYGTIDFGERIIASDPPSGYLDPAVYSDLDRFTVTFDSANYVYIDDITVEVTGGIAPVVIQTRRRETDDVDTVEIVLDGPLPPGELTRFIFNDGQGRSGGVRVPHSSQREGWGTDSAAGIVGSSVGIVPSPTLVFDKNGAPGYADRPSILPIGEGPHSGPYAGSPTGGAPTINVIEYSFNPITTGGCCTSDGACMEITSDSCAAATGSTYLGGGTPCAGTDTNSDGHDDACDFLFPIPAVSDWGLLAMTLLVLMAGTLVLARQRRSAT